MPTRLLQHVNVVDPRGSDAEAVRHRLEPAGAAVEDQHPWSGRRRFTTGDPWGARIEVLEGPPPTG
jgi:hypothetical protein